MLPKSTRKHTKGQEDHVDAWLISYADMITLLFAVFVIFVTYSGSKHGDDSSLRRSEPERFSFTEHFGTVMLGTPFDGIYQALQGVVTSGYADQNMAIEKSPRALWIDISAVHFFKEGTATIPDDRLSLIKNIVQILKERTEPTDLIEIESDTDDEPLDNAAFADNWQLSAMRGAYIARLMITEGIEPSRLRTVSYAGYRPIVPNDDEAGNPIPENRQRNQRIIIRVEKAPAPASEQLPN